ncbi:hypothetical protein UA08_07881 [Talaromyces atroroseus]|uniref:RNase MRP protein 1 RNA binding domain-containing protein n=1 Tax=Talaromyces atroroseus TaxID=1441469 RepID=A0A225A7T2_TALAT|nr:hypothetical protein UA08_07881 [Talaromyces atroroseus]OKL56751.1 hypothetical protein UA08_07881 [Talaromyces atroroseus]
MDQSRLQKTFSTVHLVYHRNKNQHGKTAWWKWLSILRRSLLKLLLLHPAEKNKKRQIMLISKYLHTQVIPNAYVAFSTVVADGQFSTLGTVLLAALAQTKKIILPLPQPKPNHSEINQLPPSSITTKTNDADDDFGTPIRRAPEHDAVELPKINEQPAEPKKVKKSKAKKKKSANAIDDIFNALR